MIKILETLGTHKNDLNYLCHKSHMSIYDKISKNVVVNPLKEKFEGVDDDLIVLLENMLEFNPYFRQ